MSNNDKTPTTDAAPTASETLLKRQRENQRRALLKRRQRKSGQ